MDGKTKFLREERQVQGPSVYEVTFEAEARGLEGMRKVAVTRVTRPGDPRRPTPWSATKGRTWAARGVPLPRSRTL